MNMIRSDFFFRYKNLATHTKQDDVYFFPKQVCPNLLCFDRGDLIESFILYLFFKRGSLLLSFYGSNLQKKYLHEAGSKLCPIPKVLSHM